MHFYKTKLYNSFSSRGGRKCSMTRAWPGVMARPRRHAPLASRSRERSVIGLVIHDLHDHDISFSTVANDRVQEPPERRQILDVEVLQAIRVPEERQRGVEARTGGRVAPAGQGRENPVPADGSVRLLQGAQDVLDRLQGRVRTRLRIPEAG